MSRFFIDVEDDILNKKEKFHVSVVEGCTKRVVSFSSNDKLNKFLTDFVEKHGSLDDGGDNWIDDVYYGVRIKPTLDIKLKNSK